MNVAVDILKERLGRNERYIDELQESIDFHLVAVDRSRAQLRELAAQNRQIEEFLGAAQ